MESKHSFSIFAILLAVIVCGNVYQLDQRMKEERGVVVITLPNPLVINSKGSVSRLQEDWVHPNTLASPKPKEAAISDLECVAEAVVFEAGGERLIGQKLVAQSIMNRVKSKKFPNTACGVVKQRVNGVYQYSYLYRKNLKIDKSSKQWQNALVIATEALSGHYEQLMSNKFYKVCNHPSGFFDSKLEYEFRSGNHCFFKVKGENV